MNSASVASSTRRRPIPLTKGLTAWVSPEDWRRVMRHKWCAHSHRGGLTYAQANVKIGSEWKRVLLHRVVMKVGPGETVDHRDGNGLNNTRDNLRIVVGGGNQHNSGHRQTKNRSSRFKGVSWHKGACKWRAQIMCDRKYHNLGLHATEEDAARAYDRAARELHGEFARVNFPGEIDVPVSQVREDELRDGR